MIELTDRHRQIVGWTVSIFFNIGLLIIGTVWLIQPARFQVEAAKSSTEIDLAAEPPATPAAVPPSSTPTSVQAPPVPITAPAIPSLPVEPSPLPPNEPAPVPAAVKTAAIIIPEPVRTPSPPINNVPVKPHPSTSSPSPKTSSAKKTSHASRGATNARPDEMHNEPPEYPEESRLAHEQGIVTLRVQVTARGEPIAVNVRQSSGYTRLDQAALEAVRHWRFHPALTVGIPVSSEVDVPVRFKLQ